MSSGRLKDQDYPSYSGEDAINKPSRNVAHRGGNAFFLILGIGQLLVLVIYLFAAEYGTQEMSNIQYIFYKDVALMMLVGFGFLMTFLSKYGLGSIGFTFLLTCIIVQWGAICSAFFMMAFTNMSPAKTPVDVAIWAPYPNGFDRKIQMDVNSLLNGNFAAATVLISFGGLIGKVGPARMALLAFLEVICYCCNRYLITTGAIGTTDMGGTIFIHLFGAYFGLSASWIMVPKNHLHLKKNLDEGQDGATYVSDLFSLVGTVFLWLYWPSFNGATAPGTTGTDIHPGGQQLWITINTVIGLCGCCVSAFIFSRLIGGEGKEFRPVDIQNATLAGGVAMGAASNLQLTPGGACGIGIVAGMISCYGFARVQPKLENVLNLHDTCGIHNLHGMPALFGTFVVIIATLNVSREKYGEQYDIMFPCGSRQASAQLGGGLATFFVAILCGLTCGKIVTKVLPMSTTHEMFQDHVYWEVADDYARKEV